MLADFKPVRNDGGVDTAQLQAAFEDVFDQGIVFHGFTEYMRDYEVIVYATGDPRTGIVPKHLSYRFTHCVRATVTSAVPADVWASSLDERLIDYDTGVDLDGYVWGVNWQVLYPGMTLLHLLSRPRDGQLASVFRSMKPASRRTGTTFR